MTKNLSRDVEALIHGILWTDRKGPKQLQAK